jgi:hypothetical protein
MNCSCQTGTRVGQKKGNFASGAELAHRELPAAWVARPPIKAVEKLGFFYGKLRIYPLAFCLGGFIIPN